MNALTRDPLLAVAKILLLALMAMFGLAVLACLVAIPGLLVFRDVHPMMFADAFPGADPAMVTGAIVVILSLTLGLLVLVFLALNLLRQIIDTVGDGDPFVPANARRLSTMAWLVLAIQVVTVPLGGLAVWLSHFSDGHHDVHVDGGISGNGLLLMLVLFILARVFRQGTAMRAELEGTV